MAEEKTEEKVESKPAGNSADNTMAMLAHILGIFTVFIGPLVIYLTKPEEGYVRTQAKEALNFQITILIGYVVGWILTFIVIGILVVWAAGIYSLIMAIIAGIAASKGEDYKYPFAIRLVK